MLRFQGRKTFVLGNFERMSESHDSRTKTLNFNVGVLGHVDSGKTSLARALSSTASTAAFDKNPQSRERGITLDLGFSSFTVDCPDHLRDGGGLKPYDSLQFTLVDCPGHASLIRTIIGGNVNLWKIMDGLSIMKGQGLKVQHSQALRGIQTVCNGGKGCSVNMID